MAEEHKVETGQERPILTEYLEKELKGSTSVAGLMFQLLHSDVQQVRNEVSKVNDRIDQTYKELINRDDQTRSEVSKVNACLEQVYKDLVNRQDQMQEKILARQDQMQKEMLARQDQMQRDLGNRIDNVGSRVDNLGKRIDGINGKFIALLSGIVITLITQFFVLFKH